MSRLPPEWSTLVLCALEILVARQDVYEVRNWRGWQQHQTLSLLATWFLVRETARGKKMDPCNHLTTDSSGYCHDLARGVSVWDDFAHMLKECQKRLQRNELARFYHWKKYNLLAPLNLYKRQF